ncbi:oxygen-dependent coproporphyrinogen oxidase [Fibrivirga algicola]|uniref:coproporphyrinogen oxidase n=1 Tax=Fibrivirga algicola TaxID=2950420 RepID=A0ABX0QAB2_9BACT|nr:oxygen-dependent coproporphyrinogen oxidase [Fibrivirga algicola]NID09176.1 oxygen-dependent coproporphyrinogen oxidase [Fibrivirga algicola]
MQQPPDRHQITTYLQGLQEQICTALEQADGSGTFREDHWQRPGGGGGRSRVLADGTIIEKGGVGFSAVEGEASEATLRQLNLTDRAAGPPPTFYATGVSIVIHPRNPRVPIIHMNVRYFELSNGTYWFGGGIDLTPHYVVPDDARWFHQQLKTVCDQHDPSYYPRFKTWADDYFFIPHRQETRGVGGIFFDYLKESDTVSKADLFAFHRAVGESFAPIYTHFMQQNHNLPYSPREQHWQGLRRGRYVEFNLAWDRGTKFGLETNGRTESILMSMPPQANWIYDYHPEAASPESDTLAWLRKGVNWADV